MLARILVAALVLLPQDAKQPQVREDAWKGGAPVPRGAVGVVAELPVPVAIFVDEMASRHVRADSPIGGETLNSLIDEILVANEADRRRMTVPDADVDRRVNELNAQLRQQKTSLEAEMASKGISMDVFRAKLKKQMLLEQLTREDQKIPRNEPVRNEQQMVWLKNRRETAKVELDRSKLKKEEVALVEGTAIDDRMFVRALLSASEKKDVRKVVDFLMQYVFGMHLLEQAGVPLTEADVEQEFQQSKRLFESNPEFRGIDHEAFVKERTGMDIATLKRSRQFRLNAAVAKLGRALFSPTDVKAYYDQNLSSFGPRFTVRHLLIRGSDRPLRDQSGKALTQSLAQAKQQIDGIRRELDQGKRFEDLVQMYSEHLPTRLRGGQLDTFTPKTAPTAFPELGEAVTKLEIGRISDPILTSAGYHLVKVERMDPPPPVEQVDPEIRKRLAGRHFSDAYDKAAKGWDIKID